MNTTLFRNLLGSAVLAALALSAVGCNAGQPAANPSPTVPTATATGQVTPTDIPVVDPTETATLPVLFEFRTDGAGPYKLPTTRLVDLQAAGAVSDVGPMEGCAGNTSARGTGVWQDLTLGFRSDGRLYVVTNRSLTLATPSGAHLGTKLEDTPGGEVGLRTIYKDPTLTKYELVHGDAKAFEVVTIGGGGIMFDLNENGVVVAMHAGQPHIMRQAFNAGQPYC